MTIRGLMVAVVGAAIISGAVRFGWWGYHAGADAGAKLAAIFLPACATPILLGLLVTAAMRPGPKRDATIHAVCMAPATLVMSGFFLSQVGLLAYIVCYRPDLLPVVAARRDGMVPGLILMSLMGSFTLGLGLWSYAPRRCPTCGWRALIRSRGGWGGGFRRRRPGEPVTPPPRPYGHFWCAACGARHKQKEWWAVPWEDASAPAEDRHYDFGLRRNRENRKEPMSDGLDPGARESDAGRPVVEQPG